MSATRVAVSPEVAIRKINLTDLPEDSRVAYRRRVFDGENPENVLRAAQTESYRLQGEKVGRGFRPHFQARAEDDVANGLAEIRVGTCFVSA